ncbi:MAG: flavodoxin family protein [Promethearchaeota archaeon]
MIGRNTPTVDEFWTGRGLWNPMGESMCKSILGIVGSPRRGGNTEILVDEILAGAAETGALTNKTILNELEISPCQACNICHETGRCVQQDDMMTLLENMQQSQVWVLGTPIYWWGPSAQLKMFIDRWYGIKRDTFNGRLVILTIPMGGGHPRYARHTVGILTDILDYLGMELIETVLAPGAHSLGAVRRHTDIMSKARQSGRKAIEQLK